MLRKASLVLILLVTAAALLGHWQLDAHRGQAQTPDPTPATAVPAFVDAQTLPPDGGAPPGDHPRRHPAGDEDLHAGKLGSTVPAAPESPSPALAAAPTLGTGFDGINDAESSCGCLPPDGAIAAGPNHLVGAVNTAFKVWDKSGNVAPGFPKSLASLFAGSTCLGSISDPFAEYDPVADRFVLGALTYNSSNT